MLDKYEAMLPEPERDECFDMLEQVETGRPL